MYFDVALNCVKVGTFVSLQYLGPSNSIWAPQIGTPLLPNNLSSLAGLEKCHLAIRSIK